MFYADGPSGDNHGLKWLHPEMSAVLKSPFSMSETSSRPTTSSISEALITALPVLLTIFGLHLH